MTTDEAIRKYLDEHPGFIPLVELREKIGYGSDAYARRPLRGAIRRLEKIGAIEVAGGWTNGSFRVRAKE